MGLTLGKVYAEKEDKPIITTRDDPLAVILYLINYQKLERSRNPDYQNVFSDLWVFEDTHRFEPLSITCTTPQHRELARQIRQYFTDRYVQKQLSGDFISPWLQSLMEVFKRTQERTVLESDLPTLVKLHAFYEHDNAMMEFSKNFVSCNKGSHKEYVDGYAMLTCVGKSLIPTREGGKAYWMADENNFLYLVKPNSPGMFHSSMIEQVFSKCASIKISGLFEVVHDREIPNFNYIRCHNSTAITEIDFSPNPKEVVTIFE